MEEGFADEIYGVGSNAAASAVRPTMMSMKAHGLQEITARMPEEPQEPQISEEELDKRAEIVKRVMIANRAVEAIIQ